MDTLQAQLNGTKPSPTQSAITIGTTTTPVEEGGKEVEARIYTVTLGNQTIELLPFKNWTQLDVHKWVVQGKLPASPAGLEVTLDHVKIAGETVRSNDPEGCAKLERVFSEWLELERGTLELARQRLHSKAPSAASTASKRPESRPLHYQVQLDQERQVHIQCLQGKEVLAAIGLNVPGFNSLADQGLLRKPHSLKVGVLHDWVEMDGVLYSFEKGNNEAAKLERVLNERYLSNLALGQGKDVVLFANAASSTGFDMQFSVQLAGVPDNRRRPLNEDTLDLLQDAHRCGLLHSGLVVKLSRPTLIFKQKTQDGGERYLEKSRENSVVLKADNGTEKVIDLSQPVNYLRLSAVELTAVFNHPAVNKHSKSPVPANNPQEPVTSSHREFLATTHEPVLTITGSLPAESNQISRLPANPPAALPAMNEAPPPRQESAPLAARSAQPQLASQAIDRETVLAVTSPAPQVSSNPPREDAMEAVKPTKPSPNLWLKPILAQTPIRFDWFSCLIYGKIAEHYGNSHQGQLGPMSCWAVALGETEDIEHATFKGIFLTEKHGLGFLGYGHMARFYKGVTFIGTHESALEGIGISLVAVGIDFEQRVVFIVADDYLSKFEVPERSIRKELSHLMENGAAVMSVDEALNSSRPFEVVWTVPSEQQNPTDPQPMESIPEYNTEFQATFDGSS